MRKTIFWNLKAKPLNITHLTEAQIQLKEQDKDTALCLENVDSNDLQLISNALSIYHGLGKEFRALQGSIEKLHTGHKLIFDKNVETQAKDDRVVAQVDRVFSEFLPAAAENASLKKELVALQEKIFFLEAEFNKIPKEIKEKAGVGV